MCPRRKEEKDANENESHEEDRIKLPSKGKDKKMRLPGKPKGSRRKKMVNPVDSGA